MLDLDEFGEVEIDVGGEGGTVPAEPFEKLLEPVGATVEAAGAELPGFFDPDRGDDVDDAPRTFAVVLFDGTEVTGPFHRPAPSGAPMVEVCPITKDGKGRLSRGACIIRVPHDFDEEQLGAEVDEGPYYLVVRAPGGRILAGNSIRIGRSAARLGGIERKRRREPSEGSPPADDRLGKLLDALHQRQQHQDQLLEKLLNEKVAREQQDAREAAQRDRDRFEKLVERFEKANRAPKGGGQANPVEGLRSMLEQYQQLGEVLGEIQSKMGGGGGGGGEEDWTEWAAGKVETWTKAARAFMGGDGEGDDD